MPTLTTIGAIFLGTHRDLDNDETRLGAERASELIGTTFGSEANPLARDIFDLTLRDGNDDGGVSFNSAGGVPLGEYVTAGGGAHYLDTGILYSGTLTYFNGDTVTGVPLRVLQDTDGNLALVPPPSVANAAEISALTTRPIRAIEITGVLQNNFGRLSTSRYGFGDEPTFVCFRTGTLIETTRGEVPVEELRAGDMVVTRDHGPQPLRWVGSKAVDAALLQAFDKMRPVRIAAGALGNDLPRRDLYVSQQHRVLVSSKIAERMFGKPEVLIAAKHLTSIAGIEIDDSEAPFAYFHLLFDRHQIVCSEGALTESLFTGPEALKSVDPAAKAEILALFPELLAQDGAWEPARPLSKGRKGRQLAMRHAENHRELQQAL